MTFQDFKNQIIVKAKDDMIGTRHRVLLQLFYKPHMKEYSHTSGFIAERGFDVAELKKMDALEPYKIVWTEKEKAIDAYFFHKIVE